MDTKRRLEVLDARVERRAEDTRRAHPTWPCAAGCDDCCRALARLPEVTREEWQRLREAVASLPAETREDVQRRVREAAGRVHVVCPLLELATGRCRVYEARPLACRTYGFYTERDGNLCCAKVTAEVTRLEARGDDVVWGNGDALRADQRAALGEVRGLDAWMLAAERVT